MKTLFLLGYGLSIKVKNTRLVFSQGIDPFSNTKEVLQLPASACPFDKVMIQGKGFVSTEALSGIEIPHSYSFESGKQFMKELL